MRAYKITFVALHLLCVSATDPNPNRRVPARTFRPEQQVPARSIYLGGCILAGAVSAIRSQNMTPSLNPPYAQF